MKRILSLLLAVLILQTISVIAFAQNLICTVSADTVEYAGAEVAVPLRIADNPGFTNFSLELSYDPRQLELVRIQHSLDGSTYLCPETVSINLSHSQQSHMATALVIAAAPEPVTEDGVLFVAVFRVLDPQGGECKVNPKVNYIRNNGAVFSVFETITALVTEGAVLVPITADVNGDGKADGTDVDLIYSAYLGEVTLTPAQMAIADVNHDGMIEYDEVMKIYQSIWRNEP